MEGNHVKSVYLAASQVSLPSFTNAYLDKYHSKKADFANNDGNEADSGSYNDRKDFEHNGVRFMEISNSLVNLDELFIENQHLIECSTKMFCAMYGLGQVPWLSLQ